MCVPKAEAKLSELRDGGKSSSLVRRDCRANTVCGSEQLCLHGLICFAKPLFLTLIICLVHFQSQRLQIIDLLKEEIN